MRMEYPSNVKIIRVPCTGKVDALYLLKALESGVDGVYVAGCMEGDCHFLKGNIRARKRVGYVSSSKVLGSIQKG
jgi:F420-non-reducing hydrogenase iron-sulfur subunit